jgi:hypothetical protein
MTAVMKPYVKEYNSAGELLNPLGPEGYRHPFHQYKDQFGEIQSMPFPNHLQRRRMMKKQSSPNNRKLTLGRLKNRVYHPLFNYFINGVPVLASEFKKEIEKAKLKKNVLVNAYKIFTGKYKITYYLN